MTCASRRRGVVASADPCETAKQKHINDDRNLSSPTQNLQSKSQMIYLAMKFTAAIDNLMKIIYTYSLTQTHTHTHKHTQHMCGDIFSIQLVTYGSDCVCPFYHDHLYSRIVVWDDGVVLECD